MSNRRKRQDGGVYPFLILTEHNKKEIAEFTGHEIQDCDLYLLAAKSQGYKGVRLGPFTETSMKDPRFKTIQEMEVKDAG